MKGLVHIPSLQDLAEAYGILQNSAMTPTLAQWALWSQWARLDARLAEQLVQKLFTSWEYLSPIALNQHLQNQPWPQSFGVLTSNVELGFPRKDARKKLFQQWSRLVMFDFSKANFEQYFIGTMKLGGSRMLMEATRSSKTFLKWGYLGKDILWNKNLNRKTTVSSKIARENVLDQMIRNKKTITVREYIDELGGIIHIRQAQRDLAKHKKLKGRGKTNARIYSAT